MANHRIFVNALSAMLLALVSLTATAQPQSPDFSPKGPHCDVNTPPSTAGERIDGNLYAATMVLVHPRAKTLPGNFNGCQTVWVGVFDDEKWPPQWQLVTRVKYKNGWVDVIGSLNTTTGQTSICRYEFYKLTDGPTSDCPALKEFPLKSMRPGCLKALARVDNSPNGLKGCQEEQ